MVFSFFKKKDQSEELPQQPTYKQPAGTQPAGEKPIADPGPDTMDGHTLGSAVIEVNDSGADIQPEVEEAAILYANEQTDTAVELLSDYIETHPQDHNEEPWLLLFELYQQCGLHTEFDELAIKYVVRFERSAPIWREAQAPTPIKPEASTRSNYVPFSGHTETGSNRITELQGLIGKGEKIRLDFGKFESLEAGSAQELLQALLACRKAKILVQMIGGNKLTDWLQNQIEMMRKVDAEIPYWLLLLEMYLAQGQQETFENLAVDYAVTYEVSPPSWESSAQPAMTLEEAEEEATLEPVQQQAADIFYMHGALTDRNSGQLRELTDFAANHAQVLIDATSLSRVDFISAGNLLNTLMPMVTIGKPVVFDHVNALIYALFRIMGINDLVMVRRRK
ncbi:hypothetical protein [Chitinivorax sp. B]|uniref:hypothetical protein n=1 Tax=Chitinivorax sp. B TaxID=2502235 RepID=UPI0010F5A39D|nr:hypothetical protein [Chitinivorax sp. B]